MNPNKRIQYDPTADVVRVGTETITGDQLRQMMRDRRADPAPERKPKSARNRGFTTPSRTKDAAPEA